MLKRFSSIVIGVIFIATLIGCQQKVIFTDRQQNILIPSGQMVALGDETYTEQLKTAQIITRGAQAEMVARVSARLIPVVEHDLQKLGKNEQLSQLNWKFTLVSDNKTVNAYCLPGGKVVVYTGLLKLTSNDDELAVVLAHEIAHALADHGNERMSEQLVLQFGGQVLDKILEKNPEQTKQVYKTIYGIGTTVGVALPHSRTHETEADKIGLILLIQAGYNPAAASSFWNKMQALGGAKPPEFLSTHPADERRAAELKDFIPEASKYKTF